MHTPIATVGVGCVSSFPGHLAHPIADLSAHMHEPSITSSTVHFLWQMLRECAKEPHGVDSRCDRAPSGE